MRSIAGFGPCLELDELAWPEADVTVYIGYAEIDGTLPVVFGRRQPDILAHLS